LTIHLPQLVNHGDLLTLGLNDRLFNLRKFVIHDLAAKAHLFAAIETDLAIVSASALRR
jgi:hypothetical protein